MSQRLCLTPRLQHHNSVCLISCCSCSAQWGMLHQIGHHCSTHNASYAHALACRLAIAHSAFLVSTAMTVWAPALACTVHAVQRYLTLTACAANIHVLCMTVSDVGDLGLLPRLCTRCSIPRARCHDNSAPYSPSSYAMQRLIGFCCLKPC